MSTLNTPNDTPAIPDDLIQLATAAKLLGTSRQTVLRWILTNRIVGWRIGYRWRVSKADVLGLVERFGNKEANERRAAIDATLPLSKRELADREKQIDAELRRAGIRK